MHAAWRPAAGVKGTLLFSSPGACVSVTAESVLQRKHKEGKQAPASSQAEAPTASQPVLAARSGTPPAKRQAGSQAGNHKEPGEDWDTTAYGLVLRVRCNADSGAFDAVKHDTLSCYSREGLLCLHLPQLSGEASHLPEKHHPSRCMLTEALPCNLLACSRCKA